MLLAPVIVISELIVMLSLIDAVAPRESVATTVKVSVPMAGVASTEIAPVVESMVTAVCAPLKE